MYEGFVYWQSMGLIVSVLSTIIGTLKALQQNKIKSHYSDKLASQPTDKIEEICFAGGFFILTRDLIDIYVRLYDEKIK